MSCQVCGGNATNPEWNYCPECGANLKGECKNCGHINDAGANFCVKCGHALRQGLTPVVLKINDSLSLVVDNKNISAAENSGYSRNSSRQFEKNAARENIETIAKNEEASKLSVDNYKNVEITIPKKEKGAEPVDYLKIAEEVIGAGADDSLAPVEKSHETLGLNTFNESETPDFLKDLIAKNKKKKHDAAEIFENKPEILDEPDALSSASHKSLSLPPLKHGAAKKEPKSETSAKKPIIEDVNSVVIEKNKNLEPVEKNNEHVFIDAADSAAPEAENNAIAPETAAVSEEKNSEPKVEIAPEKTNIKPKLENIFNKEKSGFEKPFSNAEERHESAKLKIEDAFTVKEQLKHEASDAVLINETEVEVKETPVTARPDKSDKSEKREAQLKTYRLIAVDSGNNRIQFIDSDGKFISSFGLRGSGKAQFDNPQKAVIDSQGNIFVSDFSNNRIQKFNKDGQYLTSFGTYGTKGGEFNYPAGMAISKEGLLFVVDSYNNRIQIFDLDGEFVSKYEGIEGSASNEFDTPSSIAIDNENCIYVCDTGNNRIIKFDSKWKKIFELGQFNKKNAGFDNPSGISVGFNDNLIVADTGNHLIKVFEPDGNMTFCFGAKGFKEGKFDSPGSAVIDSESNFYVADTWNNRIQIFSSDGRFIKVIGAYGADPGKFNHINDIIICN